MNLHEFELKTFAKLAEKYQLKYKLKELMEIHMSQKGDLDICLKNGLRFLEMECSLLFGYTGEFIGTDSKITKCIPTFFESALVYTLLLTTGIQINVLNGLQKLMKHHQMESGFWNFFLRDDSRKFKTIDDDIDDSSLAVMSLYLEKAISRDDCVQICEKMLEHFILDNNGLLGAFLKPPGNCKDQAPNVLVTRFSECPSIDIGSCVNCFWLFGTLGLDNILQEKFQPTLRLIGNSLERIGNNEMIIPHAKYYTNSNIIIFLMTRFVTASKLAENLYKEKLVDLIIQKLKSNNFIDKHDSADENVIDIACHIISAINMNLHIEGDEKENVKVYLLEKLKKLLRFQLPNGSFPRAPFYKWAPLEYYAVSKAVSTAFAVCAMKLVRDSGIEISKLTE